MPRATTIPLGEFGPRDVVFDLTALAWLEDATGQTVETLPSYVSEQLVSGKWRVAQQLLTAGLKSGYPTEADTLPGQLKLPELLAAAAPLTEAFYRDLNVLTEADPANWSTPPPGKPQARKKAAP